MTTTLSSPLVSTTDRSYISPLIMSILSNWDHLSTHTWFWIRWLKGSSRLSSVNAQWVILLLLTPWNMIHFWRNNTRYKTRWEKNFRITWLWRSRKVVHFTLKSKVHRARTLLWASKASSVATRSKQERHMLGPKGLSSINLLTLQGLNFPSNLFSVMKKRIARNSTLIQLWVPAVSKAFTLSWSVLLLCSIWSVWRTKRWQPWHLSVILFLAAKLCSLSI